MRLPKAQFDQVRRWMYRNARPLDLARFNYHFENGSKEEVINTLKAYQNEDGGFGHALEADSWNPNSSPIQTWTATEIIHEIDSLDKENEVIQGILKYLQSEKHYRNGCWEGEVPTNNDYPRAPWWTYNQDNVDKCGYNPTACLIGFVLLYGDRASKFYKQMQENAKLAVDYIMKKDIGDMHELACFIRLYEYCEKAEQYNLFSMNDFKARLKELIRKTITYDKEQWGTCYVCKPSQLMDKSSVMYDTELEDIMEYETRFIIESMKSEGCWDINWSWGDYPAEWAISENWWKGYMVVKYLLYLEAFDK